MVVGISGEDISVARDSNLCILNCPIPDLSQSSLATKLVFTTT